MKSHNTVKTIWNIIKTETGNKGRSEQLNNMCKHNPDAFNNNFLIPNVQYGISQ